MKHALIPVTILSLAACAMPVSSGSDLSKVIGKQLVSGTDSVMFNADGAMIGSFGGETLTGIWREDDGLFCRSGTLGDTVVPDACQTLVITGDIVTLTHVSGSKSVTTYTITQ